jgi:hypothetical protein
VRRACSCCCWVRPAAAPPGSSCVAALMRRCGVGLTPRPRVLCCAVLCCAVLCCAALRCAALRCAVVSRAAARRTSSGATQTWWRASTASWRAARRWTPWTTRCGASLAAGASPRARCSG